MQTPATPVELLTSARERLAQREQELIDILAARGRLREALEESAEVHDFKDEADEEALIYLDDSIGAHAAGELADVRAAQHRLDQGSYGLCANSEEPIDVRRLIAQPAAALCIACQRRSELARARKPW
jgi:RNA polymerase-binding transcription factor DksA